LRIENGKWKMENGEWRMENGEWRTVIIVNVIIGILNGKKSLDFFVFI